MAIVPALVLTLGRAKRLPRWATPVILHVSVESQTHHMVHGYCLVKQRFCCSPVGEAL